ncbi:MarR family winged helix-turn-helix transcriptional regulator [Wukongibacter sp. M2B1]|uniref:MarR family winged helix-turn-helix transcriptional regulator n=1 Tax=Wukongibacter sp. M2B1 TaxID=3088895 RepID=UPI003D7A15DD
MEQNKIMDMILDNIKKLFFPEDWLQIDMKLSKTELFAMFIVDRYGEVIMSKISDEINVSMSTATGIIDRLVKKKYLKRERSELDRRIVLIMLTEKGQKTIADLKDTMGNYLNRIYETLTDEEIRVLSNVFIKVLNTLGNDEKAENQQNEEKPTIKKIEVE